MDMAKIYEYKSSNYFLNLGNEILPSRSGI